MKYKFEKKVIIEVDIDAGDLIKWEDKPNGEKIYAIVTETFKTCLHAVSIYDNRKLIENNKYKPHAVVFYIGENNGERVTKILDKTNVFNKFDSFAGGFEYD